MIKVENLTKDFKSYKKEPGFKGALKGLFKREAITKRAVDTISFEIKKGEIVGYIGPNGAGKSTTIKMMTGILVPTSGKCTVNGMEPYKEREKNAKQIGVVFGQRTQLWWDLPLTETFSILKEIYEVPEADYKERMAFLDEVLGLKEFISSPVRTLSLGQRMRADLAASLLHNPAILYLDEPTIGLDAIVKENIRKAIKKINREYGTTVILTTHDLDDIEELCERIIIIDNGTKVYDGAITAIKDTYGFMRTIAMDIRETENTKAVDVAKHFKLNTEDASTEYKNNTISVKFNKNKISMPNIVSYVMDNAEVLDMKIYETSIEEIIKKIYNR